MNKKEVKKNKRGFTIIESFIAVVLFTLAVAATLSLLSKSVFFSSTSADRITAVYLAQEGLEFIRNTRTGNTLAGQPWLTGLTNCNTATGCYIDSSLGNSNASSRVKVCPAGIPIGTSGCPPLRYDASLFTYGYTTGALTLFKRTITVIPQSGGVNPNADEVLVTVTVSWTQKNIPYAVTLKDHLFNWQ